MLAPTPEVPSATIELEIPDHLMAYIILLSQKIMTKKTFKLDVSYKIMYIIPKKISQVFP